MGLDIAHVFQALHCSQRVALKLHADKIIKRCYRKGIAIDKDKRVFVRLCQQHDGFGQQVELYGMLRYGLTGAVEILRPVHRRIAAKKGVNPEWLREVTVKLGKLNVNPPVGIPVNRCYVNHGAWLSNERYKFRKNIGIKETLNGKTYSILLASTLSQDKLSTLVGSRCK